MVDKYAKTKYKINDKFGKATTWSGYYSPEKKYPLEKFGFIKIILIKKYSNKMVIKIFQLKKWIKNLKFKGSIGIIGTVILYH